MMRFNYRQTALSVAIGVAVSAISLSTHAKIVSSENPDSPGDWIAHVSDSVSSSQNIYTTANGHLFNSGSYVIPNPFNSLTVNFEIVSNTRAAVKKDLTAIYVNGALEDANQFELPGGVAINVNQGSYVLGTLMAINDVSEGSEDNFFILKSGDIKIEVFGAEDETHHEGDIYGYNGTHGGYSEIELGNISILIANALQDQTNGGGGLYGVHLDKTNTNLTLKNIEITVTGGQDNKGIYGYHSTKNSSAGSTVSVDNIILRATNFVGAEGYLRAIEKQGDETLIVNQDVTIFGAGITEGRITAVMARGGDTFIGGNVNVFLHDVADASPRDDNLTAVWVARTGNVSIDGNVILSYYDDEGFTSTFDQNVTGVGIMKVDNVSDGLTYTHDAHIKIGGDVVVQLVGNAASVGLSNHSVYGVVNAGTNSSIDFINGGKSKLYFGEAKEYLHPDRRDTTEFTSFVQVEEGTWENRTFAGSFSNFETVVVTEHSYLRLDQKQTPFLAGEADLFYTSKVKSGETTIAYGHALTFNDFLNGRAEQIRGGIVRDIISMGGVLFLPADTSMEIHRNGIAQVMLLQNEEGAFIQVDGTLEVTNTTLAVTVENSKNVMTDSASAIGYNRGTIEGNGHLIFANAEPFDSFTYGTYDYKGNPTTTFIEGGNEAFVNAGVVKVANTEIEAGFNLQNSGRLSTAILQIQGKDNSAANLEAALLTLDENFSSHASLENEASGTLVVTEALFNDGLLTNGGTISTVGFQNNSTIINQLGGRMTIENLQSGEEGVLQNAGQLSISYGQNSGTVLGADKSSLVIHKNGSNLPFINAGLLEVPDLENQGHVSNASTGLIKAVNFENGENAVVHNNGVLHINGGVNEGIIYGLEENSQFVLERSNGSGELVNSGSLEVANFVLGESTYFEIPSGHVIVSKSADLSHDAYINIGGRGSSVNAYLNAKRGEDGKGLVNAHINIAEGSKLELGVVTPEDWSYEHAVHHAQREGLEFLDSSSVLVLKEKITLGQSGRIQLGSSPEEVMPLALSEVVEETPKGLFLEANSILVINVGALEQDNLDSVMVTAHSDAEGGIVHLDPEAKILVYGDINEGHGRYNLTKGFNAAGSLKARSYNSDQLYVIDSSGIRFDYKRAYEVLEDGSPYVYLYMDGHQDVEEVLPGIALGDILNTAFDSCLANNGTEFSCGVLRDPQLSDAAKEQVFNSVANISFAGGVMASAMNNLNTGFGSLYNHLTMESDAFGEYGKLWPWKETENFWLDVVGNWSKSRKLNATGIQNAGYRDHSYGFVLGYDHKIANSPVILGAAFSYVDGRLKSRGEVSPTTNKHKSYGVHFYGNYSPNAYLNLIGSLHWLHTNSDLNQTIHAGGFSSASANTATNLLAVGLRAETTLRTGIVSIIPHIEPRYVYAKARGFDTNIDGHKVWSNKMSGNSLFQIPIGVAFRTDFKTENGWNIRPNLDLQVIPQVGSTKQKTTVKDLNDTKDVLYGEYIGKFGAEMKLGVGIDKGPFTLAAKYGFGGGAKGRFDHAFMLEGRVRW